MNVPSYFLIVLGGFAIVWGFRWAKYRGQVKPALGEFEYAAWSAIWGSCYILATLTITEHVWQWPSDNTFNNFLQVPFVVTPLIVLVGLLLGIGLGFLAKHKIISKIVGEWYR